MVKLMKFKTCAKFNTKVVEELDQKYLEAMNQCVDSNDEKLDEFLRCIAVMDFSCSVGNPQKYGAMKKALVGGLLRMKGHQA